jgi:hypothetical protein
MYAEVQLLPALPVQTAASPAGALSKVRLSPRPLAIGVPVKLAPGVPVEGSLEALSDVGLIIGIGQSDMPYKVVNLKTGSVSPYAETHVVWNDDVDVLGDLVRKGRTTVPMQLNPNRPCDTCVVECLQGHSMLKLRGFARQCSTCNVPIDEGTEFFDCPEHVIEFSLCQKCFQGLWEKIVCSNILNVLISLQVSTLGKWLIFSAVSAASVCFWFCS